MKEIINLHTRHTTCQMGVTEDGFLLQLYYGARVRGKMDYLLTYHDRGFSGVPFCRGTDRTFSPDVLPQVYPCRGSGDFRTTALSVEDENGVSGCDLRYRACRRLPGKYSLEGLPAVYADPSEAETVEIDLADDRLGLRVTLRFGILYDLDVITRSVCLTNTSDRPLTLTRAASLCLDLPESDYDLIHLPGRYGFERVPERSPLTQGRILYESRRGHSGHAQNPFAILAGRHTTETAGCCYGLMFVYSGNFAIEAEKDPLAQTRLLMGIQPEAFAWTLMPGDAFETPEAVTAMTGDGLGALSHICHDLVRGHICRGPWRDMPRPVLINNWEATYFDFNGKKILDIARQAADLGIEMMVLDDGWFGCRQSDMSSLGDWYVNEEKLGGSLKDLADQVHGLGMKFGLWIEPEMISEDSDLYRAHPDWAFKIPGKDPVRSRFQLALDFSREEIVDAVFEQIAAVIEGAGVDYVKIDANRSLSDIYTAAEGRQNAGAVSHRYILGVYRFLSKLLDRFPGLLMEGCCGGGGRFDAGMLYYTPQIWCSDNTDAVERLFIQYGTSFAYPVSAVGAHVSIVPSHQTGRVTPFNTRALTAMAGSFGYELDPACLSEEEKNEVRRQITCFKTLWPLIHRGIYDRLTAPSGDVAAWSFVSRDQSEALLCAVVRTVHFNVPVTLIHLRGLDPEADYKVEETGQLIGGDALMQGGWPLPMATEDYQAFSWHLVRV